MDIIPGRKILVVPSIRENCFNDFLKAWQDTGDWNHLILIEDNTTKTFSNPYGDHYSWKEIDETLGEDSWIISRRDSAIRSFGFLMAYQMGAEYILTLDDDCYPYDNKPIFQSHIDQMNSYHRWTTSVPNMRTRGLPYQNLGKLDTVVANMGLWSNIPDLDAVQSLNDIPFATKGDYEPPKGNRIIPSGQYIPLCGMNYCFHHSVAALSYSPLMGKHSPYARFDDIWQGIIFKKVIDHLGLHISVGEPFISHQRASNIFTNLVKEAPGIKANETFWETIDDIILDTVDPVSSVHKIGTILEINKDEYIAQLGKALQIWSGKFI